MSVDALMAEIGKLDFEDRFEIVRRIQDSAEIEAELTPELKALLEQRIAESDANPGEGFTHEEVLAYVRGPR